MLIIIPEKFKNYKLKDLERMELTLPENPTQIKRKFKDSISDKIRWKIWERDNFTCKKCGSRKFLQVDHIFPESKGGKTILKNLQTLCEQCNQKKKDNV